MKHFKLASFFFFISSVFSILAFADFDHSHSEWDQVLKKYVSTVPGSTQVDYKALKKESGVLDSYLSKVSAVKKSEYEGWSGDQKLAFLINAYNAFTLKFIIKDDIPESIKDKGGFFSSPWKKKFFKIFGKEAYLDKLEHEMARKQFNNCRVHFAFNCASIGCPALRTEAWLADKLDEQFEDSTKKFLSDRSRNRYNKEKNRVEISKIFDWYEDDFSKDKTCGSVAQFVSKYLTDDKDLQKKIASEEISIRHLDYDWKLNKK